MSILSKMKNVKEKLVEVPEHPMAKHDAELRYIYLTGLAMAMLADDKIMPEEEAHLENLVKAFRLPIATMERLLSVAETLSEEQVQLMITMLKENDLEYAFLIDAARLIVRDGDCQAEEQEFLKLMVEMLGITENQREFVVDFALAVVEKNWSCLTELMTNTRGIDRSTLSPYLEEAGLMLSMNIPAGEKLIQGKTLQLSGDILLADGGTLTFDSCTLALVECNLLSSGCLQMKNCTISLDGKSHLAIKNLEVCGSSFSGLEETTDKCINQYDETDVVFSIDGAETVSISDCQFRAIPYSYIFSIKNTKAVLVENCAFTENYTCFSFKQVNALEINSSIFKNYHVQDVGLHTSKKQYRITACLFEKDNNVITKNAIYWREGDWDFPLLIDCKFINCMPGDNWMRACGTNCHYF